MTPSQAKSIYYETFAKGRWQDIDKPLVQANLEEASWQAVIDAIVRETQKDMAMSLLPIMESDGQRPIGASY